MEPLNIDGPPSPKRMRPMTIDNELASIVEYNDYTPVSEMCLPSNVYNSIVWSSLTTAKQLPVFPKYTSCIMYVSKADDNLIKISID